MNTMLIPIIIGAIMLPVITGGNPFKAWGQALALLTIIASIYLTITAVFS